MHTLLSTERPWIHTCVAGEFKLDDVGAVESTAFVKRLDGRRMRTPAGLFSEFARALQFPSYFGHNWDALDECLNDLNWLTAKNNEPVVFNISDADELLQNEPELKKLLQILSSTCVSWNQPPQVQAHSRSPRPFHVVFECTTEKGAEWIVHVAREVGVDASELGALPTPGS